MKILLVFIALLQISGSGLTAMENGDLKEAASKIEDIQITAYDQNRDFQEVLQIIRENRAEFSDRTDFDEMQMLKKMSFYPEWQDKDGSARFSVARNKTNVVGVIGSHKLNFDIDGHIAILAVIEKYRRQGLAKKLINLAGSQFVEAGATLIYTQMRKHHPVGPRLFESFAKNKGLELVVTEGKELNFITLVNRKVLGSTQLTIGLGKFE